MAGPGSRRTSLGRPAPSRPRRWEPATTAMTASPTSAHGASGTAEPLADPDQPGALIDPTIRLGAGWGRRAAARSAFERAHALADIDDDLDAPVDGSQHRLAGRPFDLDAADGVEVVQPE